ncbi:MAG TPA: hypothetical protein VGG25_13425 [Streptosporangiaceae bacterium]|jgi:WD40 repeat protein
MTPLGAWLTITIVVTAGLLIGVVLSWIDPPAWATPGRLVVILLIVGAGDIAVTYAQQEAPVTAATTASGAVASAAGLVPVRTLDGARAGRTILAAANETSGSASLLESRLDGTARVTPGPRPQDGEFAVTSSRRLVVAGLPDGSRKASGLTVTALSGRTLRVLTSPPADVTDSDPVVTKRGEVYFLRTRTVWTGQDGTAVGTKLMKVPLSGKGRPERVRTSLPVTAASLSVDAAGTVLADTCQAAGAGSVTQACLFALPGGGLTFRTSFADSSPVTAVAISPDGRYLAYGDTATNAYGGIQLYARNLGTGSVVMASRLPGNSQEPSWLPGRRRCLLFSNAQTSGDNVYLSCVSGRRGTAKVGTGDYPVWLGTARPAGTPALAAIHWRALWARARRPLLLAGVSVLGLLAGLLAGWFARPSWATRPRIATVVTVLCLLQVGGALVVPDLLVQPGGASTVAQLDPGQAGGLLIAENSTTNTGQLFAVRLNGTNTEALQFYPDAAPFLPVADGGTKFVYDYGDSDVRLVGADGGEIRDLSRPSPGVTDTSPALAAGAREVYFLRSKVVPDGPSATTTTAPAVLRVSLRGGPVRRVPLRPAPLYGPISVNAAGTMLAARCARGRQIDACVYSLATGRGRAIPPVAGNIYQLALAPDGRYLAFGTDTVLYSYSFATGKTVTVSSLPGWNEQPSWIPGGAHPCLLFTNEQTAADTIYLACLLPRPAWAPVTQGMYPVWLGG